MTFIDRADHAMRANRTTIGSGKPAAGILDPDPVRLRAEAKAVFHLVRNALPLVPLDRVHHRVEAGLDIVGVEQSRVEAPSRDLGVGEKDATDIVAPGKRIAREVPLVACLPNGRENAGYFAPGDHWKTGRGAFARRKAVRSVSVGPTRLEDRLRFVVAGHASKPLDRWKSGRRGKAHAA